jgi:hypothetical protein
MNTGFPLAAGVSATNLAPSRRAAGFGDVEGLSMGNVIFTGFKVLKSQRDFAEQIYQDLTFENVLP